MNRKVWYQVILQHSLSRKKDRCNESKEENVLKRQFQNQPYRNVVVSDLTYVRAGNR